MQSLWWRCGHAHMGNGICVLEHLCLMPFLTLPVTHMGAKREWNVPYLKELIPSSRGSLVKAQPVICVNVKQPRLSISPGFRTNKKVRYCKRITCQHLWSTVQKFASHSPAQSGCFSCCVHTCRRSQNFVDARAQPLEQGRGWWPRNTLLPTCYHTRFCCSRSVCLVVGRVPKIWVRWGPIHLGHGCVWPLEICFSHMCYRPRFGHSGSNCTRVYNMEICQKILTPHALLFKLTIRSLEPTQIDRLPVTSC